MTLPVFKAAGTGHETSVPWPTHASGDFGLLSVEVADETPSTPSGWTAVPLTGVTANGTRLFVWYKFATSGAESNVVIPGVAVNHAFGQITTFTGVHTTAPIHRIAAIGSQSGSLAGVMPGIYTTAPDCLVVCIAAWNADNAGPLSSGETNSSLSSLSERFDGGVTTGNGGGLIVLSGGMATAGAVSQTSVTLGASATLAALTIALAPANAYTVSGNWTIDGAAASNGATVEVWDRTLGVLAGTTTTTGGTGAFTASVPYNNHQYRVTCDNGADYGASPSGTAS